MLSSTRSNHNSEKYQDTHKSPANMPPTNTSVPRALGLYWLSLLLAFYLLKLPASQPLVAQFCQLLTHISGSLIQVFDAAASFEGNRLYYQQKSFAVEVSNVCSALEYIVASIALVVAFPHKIHHKMRLLLQLIVLIQSVNILRIISLLYAEVYLSNNHFDFVHTHLWPYILVCITAIFGLLQVNQQPISNAHQSLSS